MLRRVAKWAVSFVIGEAAQIFVWPILPPVGVGVMGWLQDIPWFYLAVGTMLAFAAGITWLVQFDQWRYRNRVVDKLILQRVTTNRRRDQQGHATEISIGVQLENTAMFPITCRMTEISTRFLEFYPPRREFDTRDFSVPANGSNAFQDFYITIPPQPEGTHIGFLQCLIEYGKKGRLSAKLNLRKKVSLTFDAAGDVIWVQWTDNE